METVVRFKKFEFIFILFNLINLFFLNLIINQKYYFYLVLN